MLSLDHIVVAAKSLEEGRAYVEGLLSVELQAGGQHELMGTHNLLLGLDDGLYLEVIAINPDAPVPGHNRWFGLDEFSGPPKLTNWVGRSDDIEGDMVQAFGQGVSPTRLERGDLRWQMSVIDDAQTPFGGLIPMMLDWGTGPKAADRLAASGCRLRKLILHHSDFAGLATSLANLVSEPLVSLAYAESPALSAVIDTPSGEVTLR